VTPRKLDDRTVIAYAQISPTGAAIGGFTDALNESLFRQGHKGIRQSEGKLYPKVGGLGFGS